MSRSEGLPAVIRVGGREYAIKTVAQCATCQSEHREAIEKHIVAGRPWALIAGQLVPEAGLTADHIKRHVSRGHLPVAQIDKVNLLQERRDELGQQIEGYQQVRHDEVLLARLMVQQGVQGMLDGHLSPDLSEALSAGKFLREMQSGASQMDMDLVSQAFGEVMGVIRDEVSEEHYERVVARLRDNPVLDALDAEWKRRKEEAGAA